MRLRLAHLALAMTIFSAAGCATAGGRAADAPIADAESLIRAMHDRYEGRWYRTLSFSQRTVRTPPGREPVEDTWLEWGAVPGRLRIEFVNQGGGAIYANDSTYVFNREGQVTVRRGERNDLMTLAFDVYAQDPAVTMTHLREAEFSLAPVRMDTWQGRPVYVVGAAAGDSTTKQFWIDAERLVFVRMLDPIPNRPGAAQDIRFNKYQPLGGGWIAPEVEIVVNGQRVFLEEYSDIRHDVAFDPSLFDPTRWGNAVKPASP